MEFSASVDRSALIQKDDTKFEELSETRNLQSKFINLHEQIDILKSAELITIITVMSVLLLITWSVVGYQLIRVHKRFQNFLKGSIASESSMSTIRPDNEEHYFVKLNVLE